MHSIGRLSVLALAMVAGACPAPAHSPGGSRELTPPLKLELEAARRLAEDLANDAPIARGVIDNFKLWPVGRAITACFWEGDERLKQLFVDSAAAWTHGTSLSIDFGPAPAFAACSKTKPSDIRISFKPGDSWSFIGTDSRSNDLDGPSLNIGYPQGRAWERVDKKELAFHMLHELGHALALEHEHQSPEAGCDGEFDWPLVYSLIPWTKDDVDQNLRARIKSDRLRTTAYDKKSIMHYYFEPQFFKKGTASKCFVGHNYTPSATDLQLIRETYPAQVALQDSHIQQRADASSNVLAQLRLNKTKLARIGAELAVVIGALERPLNVEFDLTGGTVTRGPEQKALEPCNSRRAVGDRVACLVSDDAFRLTIGVKTK